MLDSIIIELGKFNKLSDKRLRGILSRHPKQGRELYSKSEILKRYRELLTKKKIKRSEKIEAFLKMKPTRTISGVTPVTVLTKPYACPGNCIFCPTQTDQPKSYLSSEPGAMRAKMLRFDPYTQVRMRIRALQNIGHNIDKIELIILGGTWSYYPKKYQVWFIKECFRGMNVNTRSETVGCNKYNRNLSLSELNGRLVQEQNKNVNSKHRCVGLVIETRPDFINEEEVTWIRFLGATKVQLGVQSLNDTILRMNKRGHTVKDTIHAFKLLRMAGFKIHAHWMPNLYGSNPKKDLQDFTTLVTDPQFQPDELKIYPCLLLKNTELYKLNKENKYKPYSRRELLDLLVKCKEIVPSYCRITRLFRDIPSFEIQKGVKETNFREVVQEEMKRKKLQCKCIRCNEIKGEEFNKQDIKFEDYAYKTADTEEHFLQYKTEKNKLIGFLRLSLPREKNFIKEIKGCAMIRELHVYGISSKLKIQNLKQAQHRGIGTELLKEAEKLSREVGFKNIAVISAIGTREYYAKRRFKLGKLYMKKILK